jgi:hypothetical protein
MHRTEEGPGKSKGKSSDVMIAEKRIRKAKKPTKGRNLSSGYLAGLQMDKRPAVDRQRQGHEKQSGRALELLGKRLKPSDFSYTIAERVILAFVTVKPSNGVGRIKAAAQKVNDDLTLDELGRPDSRGYEQRQALIRRGLSVGKSCLFTAGNELSEQRSASRMASAMLY